MKIIFFFTSLFSFHCMFAQDILREKANQGDVKAMMLLVEQYSMGLERAKKPDSAKHYLSQAVQMKYPDALYLKGLAFLRGYQEVKDVPKGLAMLQEAAAKKHLLSLEVLYRLYAQKDSSFFLEKHEKIPMDLKKSFTYADQAANEGSIPAMVYLANAWHEGKGIEKNDSLAIFWLDKACQKQDAKAQILMGDWWFAGLTSYGPDARKSLLYYGMAENNLYAEIEESTWGLVGVYNVKQLGKEFFNMLMFGDWFISGETRFQKWDGNSQKFMLDREKYYKEMEAMQLKKIMEYEKRLREEEEKLKKEEKKKE